MKLLSYKYGVWVGAILILCGAAVYLKAGSVPQGKRKAVVIELFTSEGCSSCPPADALLTRLSRSSSANGAEIIPLGFHVDYWNYLGWQDRFSSHEYTLRQERYADHLRSQPYTPQLVIDGERDVVGSSSSSVENLINQAAGEEQQADVQLSWSSANTLQVAATGKENSASQVLLAITEDGLNSNVARGENGGRVLRHSAVVRELRVLGRMDHGRFETQVPVKTAGDWKLNDTRVVVFVQPAPVGSIEGAAAIGFQR